MSSIVSNITDQQRSQTTYTMPLPDILQSGEQPLHDASSGNLGRHEHNPGFTHQERKVDSDAYFSNCESSSALRGAAVSNPKHVIAERAQLPERSHELWYRGHGHIRLKTRVTA